MMTIFLSIQVAKNQQPPWKTANFVVALTMLFEQSKLLFTFKILTCNVLGKTVFIGQTFFDSIFKVWV